MMLSTGAPRRGSRTRVGGMVGWDGAGCSFPAAQLHLGDAACPGAAGARLLPGGIPGNWVLRARRMPWVQEPHIVASPELPKPCSGERLCHLMCTSRD